MCRSHGRFSVLGTGSERLKSLFLRTLWCSMRHGCAERYDTLTPGGGLPSGGHASALAD